MFSKKYGMQMNISTILKVLSEQMRRLTQDTVPKTTLGYETKLKILFKRIIINYFFVF